MLTVFGFLNVIMIIILYNASLYIIQFGIFYTVIKIWTKRERQTDRENLWYFLITFKFKFCSIIMVFFQGVHFNPNPGY